MAGIEKLPGRCCEDHILTSEACNGIVTSAKARHDILVATRQQDDDQAQGRKLTLRNITMSAERTLLEGAYQDFNARRMEAVLARMRSDVVWPNGMEGGFVYGHEGVREYWTRQWALIDPHVEPLEIRLDARGKWVVKVHQVVHDREGK